MKPNLVKYILPFLLGLLLAPQLLMAGEKVREPAMAGVFYSEDPAELRAQVERLIRKAKTVSVPGRVRGIVSPHAGYRYSGVVAGAAYKTLPKGIRKVMILAPTHYVHFGGVSIPDVDAYTTPLGRIPLAPEAAQLRKLEGVQSISRAHEKEHSLEVQLPFLQVAVGDFELIPIIVGKVNPEALARMLVPYMEPGLLVVASSDLSHYYSYERAVAKDAVCTDAVPNLKFDEMEKCEACGRTPVLTLMHLARLKGWKGELLDAQNSADTAGPMRQVVGYMAAAFYDTQGDDSMATEKTPEKDKPVLLALARSAIEARLIPEKAVQRPENPDAFLTQNRGCFVTLNKNGQLRGCIGTIEPVQPLLECVEDNAVNAAFRDPRFPPLTKEELDEIEIEISVLTVPRPLEYDGPRDLLNKLKPNVHGVILSRGMRRSTFLPQVWEQLQNPEMFLIQLCRKGGFTANCWQDPETKVEVYEAEHFSE